MKISYKHHYRKRWLQQKIATTKGGYLDVGVYRHVFSLMRADVMRANSRLIQLGSIEIVIERIFLQFNYKSS